MTNLLFSILIVYIIDLKYTMEVSMHSNCMPFLNETVCRKCCMNGLAPPYLCELFNKHVELHDRVTRNRDLLNIPLSKTLSGQRSFRFRVVRLEQRTETTPVTNK